MEMGDALDARMAIDENEGNSIHCKGDSKDKNDRADTNDDHIIRILGRNHPGLACHPLVYYYTQKPVGFAIGSDAKTTHEPWARRQW